MNELDTFITWLIDGMDLEAGEDLAFEAQCRLERIDVYLERYSQTGASTLEGVLERFLILWNEAVARDNP